MSQNDVTDILFQETNYKILCDKLEISKREHNSSTDH